MASPPQAVNISALVGASVVDGFMRGSSSLPAVSNGCGSIEPIFSTRNEGFGPMPESPDILPAESFDNLRVLISGGNDVDVAVAGR